MKTTTCQFQNVVQTTVSDGSWLRRLYYVVLQQSGDLTLQTRLPIGTAVALRVGDWLARWLSHNYAEDILRRVSCGVYRQTSLVVDAAAQDRVRPWFLQIVDGRYVTWPGPADFYVPASGEFVHALPQPAVTSVAMDLNALIARALKEYQLEEITDDQHPANVANIADGAEVPQGIPG